MLQSFLEMEKTLRGIKIMVKNKPILKIANIGRQAEPTQTETEFSAGVSRRENWTLICYCLIY